MLKFLVGLAVFPTALFLLLEAAKSFKLILLHWQATAWFVGGMAAYSLLHWLGWKFVQVYVLAHELVHAIAGLLCGYSVKGLPKVGKSGGEVVLNGSNAFVALAPYCVPLYALLLPGIYQLLLLKWPQLAVHRDIFTAGIGFFLAFHVLHTFDTLYQTKQSDISMAGGAVFSYSMITAANGIMLLAAFRVLYPDTVDTAQSAGSIWDSTLAFWRGAWHYSCSAAVWVYMQSLGGKA